MNSQSKLKNVYTYYSQLWNSNIILKRTNFIPIFLNTEKTYGDGTIMVYTKLHVLLIDINKIIIRSNTNFGNKVQSSFQRNTIQRKNITKYN